ncbi:MAG: ferrous iron transport protein B [Desulfarculaceae bacterium]|nr:ferrous iron transport protein B [Desulfarculaceae bacterium]
METDYTMALAGNPNSGKTTMFNALTGKNQRVGNFPGVTVDRLEGFAGYNGTRIKIVDLPGTYSLTAYSQEELVARNFIINEDPGVVLDIVDATSLERNLYLTVQFLELNVPVVVALNMMDEVKGQGKTIDTAKLSELVGCPVVETVARKGTGKTDLVRTAAEYAAGAGGKGSGFHISYGPDLDPVIEEMERLVERDDRLSKIVPARWAALKFLEQDPEVMEMVSGKSETADRLEAISLEAAVHLKETLNTTPEAIIADYRYGFIRSVCKQCITRVSDPGSRLRRSDQMDRVFTHRLLGPVLMAGVIYAIFFVTFTVGEIPMGWMETLFAHAGSAAESLIPGSLAKSLVVDGIIGGVGGVLGFVPLIACMFLMISFLEDSGYMARIAYMLDRVMRVFGLHGSSVMPFIVSGGIAGGCAVPGVMATRTLKSPKEKLATVLTAPFMSCGAKVPVIILMAAAFFDNSASVMFFCVAGGWLTALMVAKLLRSTVVKGESTPFIMELPPYRLPTAKGLLIHTWHRTWQYIKKAGTVILAVSIVIWAAMTFPGPDQADRVKFENLKARAAVEYSGEQLENRLAEIDKTRERAALAHSFAGRTGRALEPVTSAAGFDWRTNIALIGGFAAKEVIVSTLGTAYSMGEVDAQEASGLARRIEKDPLFTPLTAVSLLIFMMLYAPCFVTVVVIARETSWKWAAFSMVFNTGLAFALAAAVYQAGTLLGY